MMKKISILIALLCAGLQANSPEYSRSAVHLASMASVAMPANYEKTHNQENTVTQQTTTAVVVPFELARDAEPVLDLFRNNMHWLCADPHCSAEQLLSYVLQLSTAKKPDQLTLKVLRDNAQFVGFIAYHREQKHQGKILLIGVPEHARGKGYGALLIDHALGDLIQRGVHEIVLDTGIDNVTAQRLYKRAGFNVISVCPESQDHLRFGYTVATAQPIVYA